MSNNAAYVDPSPGPTSTSTATPNFSPPAKGDAVAVALTVGIVGICMFILITWLVLRLRRRRPQDPPPQRLSFATARLRPSFASDASSRFRLKRKSLRLVGHQQHGGPDHDDESWDFADPDPVQKVSPLALTKHIPPPLLFPKSLSYHSSKDESGQSSPVTPRSFDLEPPPAAYIRDDRPRWTLNESKDLP